MIVLGWIVAVQKFNYLNSIEKDSDVFLKQWKKLSGDLTALDHGDDESVKTMGGNVSVSSSAGHGATFEFRIPLADPEPQ